ncbi:hypothetical protein IPN35_06165 [Candidatus Peregrinibacteria bacterium]|nr:MAG: hypothetical protein IPN35_06165 [Candidatus Peregrinibacteria bacterium]
MSDILDTIAEAKRTEINALPDISESLPQAERDFYAALQKSVHNDIPRLIAEIKPASPVSGALLPKNADIGNIAQAYEIGGASAISVLADTSFFGGSYENIRAAKSATKATPILCKEFVLSEKQIQRARFFGADSVLLIVRLLSQEELFRLLSCSRSLGMEPLVEIADETDLHKALSTDCKIIGINNRDLANFSLDIGRTFRLARNIPQDRICLSLSGFSGADVRLVQSVANGVLVGSHLIRSAAEDEKQDFYEALRKKTQFLVHPAPLIKFCGVRSEQGFRLAEELDIPLLGLNFVPTSKRCISASVAETLSAFPRKKIRFVGVFQNQNPEEVLQICQKYHLDFAQLSGQESADDFCGFPISLIKGISVGENLPFQETLSSWKNVADVFLFDGAHPGSGKIFPSNMLPKMTKPFLVAGGVTPENVREILEKTEADGTDTASGIENESGEWDEKRMKEFRDHSIIF